MQKLFFFFFFKAILFKESYVYFYVGCIRSWFPRVDLSARALQLWKPPLHKLSVRPDTWAWVCRGLPRPRALTALCSVHRLPERLGPHRRRPLPAQAARRYVRASVTPPQTPPQTPRGRLWAVDSPLQPLGAGGCPISTWNFLLKSCLIQSHT